MRLYCSNSPEKGANIPTRDNPQKNFTHEPHIDGEFDERPYAWIL